MGVALIHKRLLLLVINVALCVALFYVEFVLFSKHIFSAVSSPIFSKLCHTTCRVRRMQHGNQLLGLPLAIRSIVEMV